MNDVSIKHPEWLYIDVNGKTSYGYDQEWFTDEWQRLSGCGPTSASQVLGYSLFRDGLLDLETTSDQTLALERMNLVWKYVKPRFGGGVYKTQWMERGLTRLLEDKDLSYDVHMLNVSPFCASRVEVEAAAQFIHDALAQDVPVAFLNRHKGKEKALYTWHWVPIHKIFMDGDDIRCGIFKSGDFAGNFRYIICCFYACSDRTQSDGTEKRYYAPAEEKKISGRVSERKTDVS